MFARRVFLAKEVRVSSFVGRRNKEVSKWLKKHLCSLPPFKQLQAARSELQLTQNELQLTQNELQLTQDGFQLAQSELHRMRDRYLSMMEACLAGTIYEDPPLTVLGQKEFDHVLREYGWDWPSMAHTMIGAKRLANLRALTENVIQNRVPGDLMETGVWRGGACILMRAVLNAYKVTDRRVWVADSFEGLPPPNSERYPADEGSIFHTYSDLAVTIEEVKCNFEKYGLLDDQVVFLKGWFQDTLPAAPVGRLAVLRLDGDMYQSTIVPLDILYDRVSEDGYVIVDDYNVVGQAKKATNDFLAKRGISPRIEEIDGVGVFWKK
jgi:Macrocin-O-methyltransferase (TylF)